MRSAVGSENWSTAPMVEIGNFPPALQVRKGQQLLEKLGQKRLFTTVNLNAKNINQAGKCAIICK